MSVYLPSTDAGTSVTIAYLCKYYPTYQWTRDLVAGLSSAITTEVARAMAAEAVLTTASTTLLNRIIAAELALIAETTRATIA